MIVVIVNICLNHDCICLIYADSFQIEIGDEHLSANGSTIQVNLRKLGDEQPKGSSPEYPS